MLIFIVTCIMTKYHTVPFLCKPHAVKRYSTDFLKATAVPENI